MKKVYFLLKLALVLLVTVLVLNFIIVKNTSKLTFSNVNDVPKNKVGLLLGTVKYLKNGNLNLYYKYRIDAAVKLYKSDKISFILVSGDNNNTEYDEPSTFKEDLIKQGISKDKIYLDYAGFRTLDSVIRAKEIFGQTAFTIISQKFHNQRAVFIANQKGMHTVGFNAKGVAFRYGKKVMLREYLARTKVFIDLLFGVLPKFLGKKIVIE